MHIGVLVVLIASEATDVVPGSVMNKWQRNYHVVEIPSYSLIAQLCIFKGHSHLGHYMKRMILNP